MELRVRRMFAVLLLLAMPVGAATVQEAVERAVSTPPFDRALWFILVEEEDGRLVYERNSNALAIPASVRKLFSASASAMCLGTQTQFETELYREGDDLILRGGGDPSFGSERYGFTDQSAFDPFIAAVRARGIRRVRDLVADVSLYDRVTIPYQWKVGNLTTDSAAAVDALAFAENAIDDYAVASPPLFTLLAFRDALTRAGIAVTGALRSEIQPRPWSEKLAAISSPFVQQLLGTVLRNSQNLYAETLYKRISAGLESASYEQSREFETQFLSDEVGITREHFRFVDGSGLASDDLVTATAIVKMLRWLNAPERRAFTWDVMAQPGGEGTLRQRLMLLGERMRGKTGTVAGVNSLAGFVRGGDGTFRYFAVIINHHIGNSSHATKLIDSIAEAIADF